MKTIPLSLAVVLLCAACNGETQDPEMSLYSARVSNSQLVPVQGLPYSNRLIIGPEGKPVLLQVRWTVGRDQSNCLRIDSLHVERKGGDPGVIISNVKHGTVPCGSEFESEDTTHFETAVISLDYRTSKGSKAGNFRGNIVNVTGTGDMIRVPEYSRSEDRSR